MVWKVGAIREALHSEVEDKAAEAALDTLRVLERSIVLAMMPKLKEKSDLK